MSETNKNPTELQLALWAAHLVIVHDARDWAATNRDAQLWAILVGWDDDAYEELQGKFGWNDDAVATLKRRGQAIEAAKGAFPESMVQR